MSVEVDVELLETWLRLERDGGSQPPLPPGLTSNLSPLEISWSDRDIENIQIWEAVKEEKNVIIIPPSPPIIHNLFFQASDIYSNLKKKFTHKIKSIIITTDPPYGKKVQ